MIKEIARNLFNFIFLVLLQVVLLNHVEINGLFNPYLYVLFILLLPFETPKWLLLVTAFLLGLSVDWFSQSLGIHAFASVAMAYVRPHLLDFLAPRDGYDTGTKPNSEFMGLSWFFRYALILVLIHHFLLFFIQVFTFYQFFETLLRAILSSAFTLTLIVLSQLFTLKR
ncbi:MAG: rod shape-determining protein MreD [Bacteroidota bacterium]|nr:rod shape-determining protein MreD [Bacteroidota bacterium]